MANGEPMSQVKAKRSAINGSTEIGSPRSDNLGSFKSARVGADDQPAGIHRRQSLRDRCCLAPADRGQLWITDTRIAPGLRIDAVEFGLPVTD